jgi:hypothetical protein
MKRLTFVVGLACVLAMFAPIAAQSPPPANYVAVTTIKVRPAAVADFEEYLKKLNAAGLKIGLKVRADTYQTVQGGSPFQYDVVQGFATLEELGAVPSVPAMLTKAHGEAVHGLSAARQVGGRQVCGGADDAAAYQPVRPGLRILVRAAVRNLGRARQLGRAG